ncbi:MAG: TadE family protein [Terriglobales bacterium]
MNMLSRQLRSTEAAEIAEAALVLPVVFLFLLGIIWFGRAFNIYSTIQQAAQQGAIAAARPTCAGSCGNTLATSSSVKTVVEAVMKASNLDTSQIIAGAPPAWCTSPDNITICQNVLLNPSSNPTTIQSCGSPPQPTPSQICGSLVTFQYPFTFNLPLLSLQVSTVTLTAQAQSRMEN